MLVVVILMSNLAISLNSFAQAVPGGSDSGSEGVPAALLNSSVEVLVHPFLLSANSNNEPLSSDAQSEAVVQAAANDAADVLNGGEATPLLKQLENGMRAALLKGGNKATYSDSDLAHMIISQADY
jgi:hypothetical protein